MATSITMAHGLGCANLPERIPHLMPFHIEHTGPAPVSTYFRIRPHAGPSSSQLSSISDPPLPDSQMELSTATTTTAVNTPEVVSFEEEKENLSEAGGLGGDADRVVPLAAAITTTAEVVDVLVSTDMKAPALPAQQSGPIQRLSGTAKRFISSFRGRTVHGVEVTLPKGYAGIILREDTNDRAYPHRSTTGGKSKRRPVRNSRRRPVEEEELLDEMSLEDEERPPAVRVLKPTARFDSFVLWHPDIPVDEGRDEYLRTLSEWTNIASEIHQSEILPT